MNAAKTPTRAFVLAAGKGLRMRPLTDDKPKPMIEVAGKPMIDHALDSLAAAGVTSAVVNLHYKGDVLEKHLAGRRNPQLVFSHETELLDTGGGVKKHLAFFGDDPFFIANADVVWTDGAMPACARLAQHWDPARMDVLIMVYPLARLHDYEEGGDYSLDAQGRATLDKKGDYVFTGLRIVKPEVFDGTPDGKFSFIEIFNAAQAKGRLYALVHDGQWHHVGTPQALARTEKILAKSKISA